MPIVFVCDTSLNIVWVDGNFCDVIDCDQHEAIGQFLHDFLDVPVEHRFREEVARLNIDIKRASYTARLTGRTKAVLTFDFYVEHVPSFDGIEGASLIAVGVQSASTPSDLAPERDGQRKGGDVDELRRTYRYSNLRQEDGRELYDRLETLIAQTEAFTKPSFTLESAAAQLNSNVLYVSQVTNYFAGVSFPNYLNQKRYEKLRSLVAKDEFGDFNEQYRQAGFGSYSGLNRFLRNRYGVSPTQFLKEVKGES